MQSNELKRKLLDMLGEDKEFRHAVAGAIGYNEILDKFADLEARMDERFAKMDERFAKIEEEIRDLREESNNLRKDMNEGFRRHDEEFARVWQSIENLRKDMNEGFRRHDEEFARVWQSIENLRKDMNEGFRRHDEEFARVWQSIENLRKDMNEGFRRHDEEFVKLRQDMNEGFRRHDEEFVKLRQDMNEGFRRHDEEFARVWQSIENLRKDMQEGFKRMDLKVSALGARWGIMNEQSVREALKGIVGEELGYTISEWNAYDDEGYVYGYPSSIQLDIVVSNGKIIVIEIASHIKRSDSFMLKKKVELYKKKEGKEISKMMFVTPFIDDDARDACNRLGIEVYTA
ncbi:MAG: DUF3782 domain-containing protein [Candidatus Nitrosocaldaceae archaeon]